MLRALTTHCQHPRLDILLSENRKLCNQSKSKRWNCVSQAMMFLQCCQQAMEESIYQAFCLAKLFASNPKCKRVSDFSAQHEVNSIVEGQFRKY